MAIKAFIWGVLKVVFYFKEPIEVSHCKKKKTIDL